MGRKLLKIQESAYRKVIQAACEAWPRECCGALLGRVADGSVTLVEAMAADGPETRVGTDHFEIGGPDMVRFLRSAQQAGLSIQGFYHSHPDAPPVPSAADLAGATWPECMLLIASVRRGRFEALAAFALAGTGRDGTGFEDARRFEAVPVEIVAGLPLA